MNFINLLLLSNPIYNIFAQCNFGSLALDNKSCKCEPGWSGETCNQLNTIPITNHNSNYNGMYDPDHPTWCGSIVNAGNKTHYGFASAMDSRGLWNWRDTSTASIWMRLNMDEGNDSGWKFLGFIGGYNNIGKPVVRWFHNTNAVIEMTLEDPGDLNSRRRYALVVYGVVKTNKRNIIQDAKLDPKAQQKCKTGGAAFQRFPVNEYTQILSLYKIIFNSETLEGARDEMRKALSKWQSANFNSYSQKVNVNTEFDFYTIFDKIPNGVKNSVNPAPLIDSRNSLAAFVKDSDGLYKVPLIIRYFKQHECLRVLIRPANKFVWEISSYKLGAEIVAGYNIEDPSMFMLHSVSSNKTYFGRLVHDMTKCGPSNTRHYCGSIASFSEDPQKNVLHDNAWLNVEKLYGKYINGLNISASSRQRPNMLFYRGMLLGSSFIPTSWCKNGQIVYGEQTRFLHLRANNV